MKNKVENEEQNYILTQFIKFGFESIQKISRKLFVEYVVQIILYYFEGGDKYSNEIFGYINQKMYSLNFNTDIDNPFVKNFFSFYLVLSDHLISKMIIKHKFVQNFYEMYSSEILSIFLFLLMKFQQFDEQTVFLAWKNYTKGFFKAVKKVSLFLKNKNLYSIILNIFFTLFKNLFVQISSIKSISQNINPFIRVLSKMIISCVSILKNNYQIKNEHGYIASFLVPLQIQLFLHDSFMLSYFYVDSKAKQAIGKLFSLAILIIEDLLFKDYILDFDNMTDQNKLSEFVKNQIYSCIPNFVNIFNNISSLSFSHLYSRILNNVSQDQTLREHLLNSFQNDFLKQIILFKDSQKEFKQMSFDFSLKKWVYNEDMEIIDEFEFYSQFGEQTFEKSIQDAGIKFIRIITDLLNDEDIMDTWAEEFQNQILLHFDNKTSNYFYFDDKHNRVNFELINILLFCENNMYEILKHVDFEHSILKFFSISLSECDVLIIKFIESYFEFSYGKNSMFMEGIQYAQKLMEHPSLVLNCSGVRILLFIFYKINPQNISKFNFNFNNIFQKMNEILWRLKDSDYLTHFLELIQDLIKVMPPSLDTIYKGLDFLESISKKDFGSNNSTIILKSSEMMVDLFVENNFSELSPEVILKFSNYIEQVLSHYDSFKDLIILENCFYQLFACFLFKTEIFLGKINKIHLLKNQEH